MRAKQTALACAILFATPALCGAAQAQDGEPSLKDAIDIHVHQAPDSVPPAWPGKWACAAW
jgi:hypothetical protein